LSKTLKLEIAYEYNFELIGIYCAEPEYKLAWELNRILNQKFIIQKEIPISLKKINYYISNFLAGTEQLGIRIIKNKCLSEELDLFTHLVPESKMFDYFLYIYGHHSSDILKKLKTSEIITYCKEINIDTLASKENLLLY
jgi:hypothetical protein